MNLLEAERESKLLMTAYGLTEKGWRFEWDNAARRFGQCRYSTKTISMSRQLAIQRPRDKVRNTMLHEIAHALTPGHGHDAVWRAKAISIGCDGKRCSDEPVSVNYNYAAVCNNGHVAAQYIRRPRTLGKKSCGKCSRSYNPKYSLKLVTI